MYRGSGQISRLVEGHITKYGLPVEHAAQCTVVVKLGSLTATELSTFVNTIEDLLFHSSIKRESAPIYKQDEIQVLVLDVLNCCRSTATTSTRPMWTSTTF
jgi:hypothetical protein